MKILKIYFDYNILLKVFSKLIEKKLAIFGKRTLKIV